MKSTFALLIFLGVIGGLTAGTPAMAEEDKVPLVFELPEACYKGTPCPYWSPYLEPESFKDRPPFQAPKGTVLVSRGKAVTGSSAPLFGELKQVTDGDKNYEKKSLVELPAGLQWIQIDLEKEVNIYAILVWHNYDGKQVYFDLIVKAGNDPEFKDGGGVLYNNDYDNSSGLGTGKDKEYIENNQGRLIGLQEAVKGRYVRLYSKGNTANDKNHYIEVEVFGKPAE